MLVDMLSLHNKTKKGDQSISFFIDVNLLLVMKRLSANAGRVIA